LHRTPRPPAILPCGLILLLCLLGLAGPAAAAVLDLDSIHHAHRLERGEAAVFCDPSAALGLPAVQARDHDFRPLPGNMGMGFRHDACWLRLQLHRSEAAPAAWWLELQPALLDDIQLYQPGADGSVRFRQSGDRFPLSSRDAAYGNFMFRVDVPAGDSTLYLRIRTSSSMVAVLHLAPRESFPVGANNRYLVVGLYIGVLMTSLVLSAFFMAASRQRLYLLYLAYLVCQLTVGLSSTGLLAEFVFPDHPAIPDRMVGAGVGLSMVFGTLFFWRLLRVSEDFPWFRWLVFLTIGCGVLAAVAALGDFYVDVAPVMFGCMVLTQGVSILPLWKRVREGRSPERFIAVAFFAYVIFVLATVLPYLGLMAPTELGVMAAQLGNIVHLLALQISILLSIRGAEEIAVLAREALDQEQHQMDEQEDFLTMITHEVRTPMAIINSAAQSLHMIDSRASEPARSQRYQRIAEAVRRMDLLVELAVNRDRLTALDPALMQSVDMVALTRGIVVQMAPEHRQRIRIDAALSTAPVLVQAGLLEFTLINLIDNACKYAPGDSPIRIEITGWPDTGSVLWSISDQGPGVAREDRERIFEKYYRAGDRSGKPGLGLGLYIAWHVIARYQGTLRYMDRGPGLGACFEIRLPWAEGAWAEGAATL
jgi:signal transduction histidine kinase